MLLFRGAVWSCCCYRFVPCLETLGTFHRLWRAREASRYAQAGMNGTILLASWHGRLADGVPRARNRNGDCGARYASSAYCLLDLIWSGIRKCKPNAHNRSGIYMYIIPYYREDERKAGANERRPVVSHFSERPWGRCVCVCVCMYHVYVCMYVQRALHRCMPLDACVARAEYRAAGRDNACTHIRTYVRYIGMWVYGRLTRSRPKKAREAIWLVRLAVQGHARATRLQFPTPARKMRAMICPAHP